MKSSGLETLNYRMKTNLDIITNLTPSNEPPIFYSRCYVQFIYKFKNRIKMEKKNLIITVAGQTASGKSRLTYLLKKFLRENGFEVNQELNIDHPTEENFDKVMSENFDNIIDNFKETRKITLREVQLPREPIV